MKARGYTAKRHALKMALLGQVDCTDIPRLCELQKWKCASCGCSVKAKWHVDHIMPLARGGLHDRRNLQILCPGCNVRKSDKHPVDWAQANGRLL
jgi:5-methylcytosine-specific restriction endonuclease McrA